jgi:hypothetical protein
LEYQVAEAECEAINAVLLSTFLEQGRSRPREVILDVDTSEDKTHGQQEFAEFNAYYGGYCYLPRFVFARVAGEGEESLVHAELPDTHAYDPAARSARHAERTASPCWISQLLLGRVRHALRASLLAVRSPFVHPDPTQQPERAALGTPSQTTRSTGRPGRLRQRGCRWLAASGACGESAPQAEEEDPSWAVNEFASGESHWLCRPIAAAS